MKTAVAIQLGITGLLLSLHRSDLCKFGTTCDYPCHCQNNAVCDPFNGSCPTGCDDGDLEESWDFWYTGAWSGYGCQLGNVAYGKIATQGEDTHNGYDAGLAIDGNHDPNVTDGYCSHTTGNSRAWWQVDLEANFVIYGVKISNREDCCPYRSHYIDISVSDTDDDDGVLELCHRIGSEWNANIQVSVRCAQPLLGRYVRLQRWAGRETHFITLCEVQVHGYLFHDCPDAYYGVACGTPCNCQLPCHDVSGECPNQLCTVGWMGYACQTALCKFGTNCDYPCHCQNNAVCDPLDGSCPTGCDDGDLEESWDDWYTSAWSGYGCQLGNVAYGKIATQGKDTYNGYDAGLAIDGNHDPDFAHGYCSHTAGNSPAWWQVDLGANFVIYGVEITNRGDFCCPGRSHYINITVSDTDDDDGVLELCHRIGSEWNASIQVSVRCAQPLLGRYVRLQRWAGIQTHIITLCEVQVHGYLFQDCPDAYYGVACGTPCNCQLPCHDVSGECPNQHCTNGWMGYACQTECNNGTWGANCERSCNCGEDQVVCDRFNGRCEDVSEFSVAMVAGITISLIFLVVLAVVTGFITRRNLMRVKDDCQIPMDIHLTPPSLNNDVGPVGQENHAYSDIVEYPKRNGDMVYYNSPSPTIDADMQWDEGIKGIHENADIILHDSSSTSLTSGNYESPYQTLRIPIQAEVMSVYAEELNKHSGDFNKKQLEQYTDICKTFLEALQAQETSVPCSEIEMRYPELKQPTNNSGLSAIQGQYMLLQCSKPSRKPNHKDVALNRENLSKNRDSNILPTSKYRAHLTTPIEGRNDYINAVAVDGYRNRKAYIATQLPMPDTVVDFWRLVYDHKCSCTIALQQPDPGDENTPVYWPITTETPIVIGHLMVTLVQERCLDEGAVNILDFEITISSKETHNVRLYQFLSWPADTKTSLSMETTLMLLDHVQRWQLRSGLGPLCFLCKFGYERCGLMIAACYMLEKLNVEQEVDVFQAVQQVRIARSEFVTSQVQYEFLYELAIAYINSCEDYANFK